MKLQVREGVSLVEVLVAAMLMAAVLSSLAGLSFTAARQTMAAAGSSYRLGVIQQETNRIAAVPYTDLPGLVGCTTVSGGTFPHTRCTTLTNISTTRRMMQVIVTPAQPGVRPDTLQIERTNPPTASPLSTL